MDKEFCDLMKKHSDEIFRKGIHDAIKTLEKLEKPPYSHEDYQETKKQILDLDKE